MTLNARQLCMNLSFHNINIIIILLYIIIKVLCYILWPIKYTVYISTSPSWKAFSCHIIHTWLARRLRLTSGHKNRAKWNKATSARNKTLGETPQSRTSDYANGSEPLLFHKYFDSSSTGNGRLKLSTSACILIGHLVLTAGSSGLRALATRMEGSTAL